MFLAKKKDKKLVLFWGVSVILNALCTSKINGLEIKFPVFEVAREYINPLSCQKIKFSLDKFLEMHYYYSSFTPELSEKTLFKFFETLDPSKVYFTQADINEFNGVKNNLNEEITANDCAFLNSIYQKYRKKLKAQLTKVESLIDKIQQIKSNEYYNLKPKTWASNDFEYADRLRRKVRYHYLIAKKDKIAESEIKQNVSQIFLRSLKRFENLSKERLEALFINSFAKSLDPHSNFMLPAEHEAFTVRISNKLEGIGVQLNEKNGAIIIKRIIPGGVAEKDGRLKVNDRITAIDSLNGSPLHELNDVDLDYAIEFIRGKKGSKMKLFISRKENDSEKTLDVTLARDEITLTEEKVKYTAVDLDNKKIGIIRIPSFYTDLKCRARLFSLCQGSAYDTEQAVKNLKKQNVAGILLDLRNNGGGDFPESIKLTSIFVSDGIAVQTVDKMRNIAEQLTVHPKINYNGPLVVITSKFSASASEIFAGAIQDYSRGVIVGNSSTFGKATVQIIQEISSTFQDLIQGAIKVTANKFYRPSGLSNQKYGVKSDIVLPNSLDTQEIGESYLDNSLEPEKINPSNHFSVHSDLSKYIPVLQKNSNERVKANPLFVEMTKKAERKTKQRKNIILLGSNKALNDSLDDEAGAEENQNIIEIYSDKDPTIKESASITNDLINIMRSERNSDNNY